MLPERSTWIYALTALSLNVVKAITEDLTENCSVRFKALPQSGLGMLKFKDSAFHEPYFLGEFTVSSAWVEITQPEGTKIEGAAQVMDDDVELASALAIADAILANKIPGWEQLAEQISIGMELRDEENRIRKAMLSKTSVDFSLLSETESKSDD